jgi:UDP-GlcNAc:undecaprenyl-phosphate GlcNAc-1-phosphate transferase
LNLILEKAWLDKTAYQAVRLAVPLFLVATAVTTKEEDLDEIAVFAAGILVTWLVWVGARLPGAGFIERVAVYSSVILVVYLAQTAGFEYSEAERWFNYAIALLAVIVGVGVRFSGRYLTLTPSDFLVMFVLLVAANLPVFSQVNYAKIAVQSAILLYGVEYVLRRGSGTVWAVRSGGMLALIALARWMVL